MTLFQGRPYSPLGHGMAPADAAFRRYQQHRYSALHAGHHPGGHHGHHGDGGERASARDIRNGPPPGVQQHANSAAYYDAFNAYFASAYAGGPPGSAKPYPFSPASPQAPTSIQHRRFGSSPAESSPSRRVSTVPDSVPPPAQSIHFRRYAQHLQQQPQRASGRVSEF